MPTKPEKDAPLTAFQMAQAQIHACVMSPDYSTYVTWYKSGNVVCVTNGEAEQAGRAYNMAGFNALLEQHGIAGLAPKGTPKRPERLERRVKT